MISGLPGLDFPLLVRLLQRRCTEYYPSYHMQVISTEYMVRTRLGNNGG